MQQSARHLDALLCQAACTHLLALLSSLLGSAASRASLQTLLVQELSCNTLCLCCQLSCILSLQLPVPSLPHTHGQRPVLDNTGGQVRCERKRTSSRLSSARQGSELAGA